MAYSFQGKGSRTYLRKSSKAQKIMEFIKLNGGISIKECKSLGNRTFEGSLWSLYRRDYVKRFEFFTNEGFIYYTDANAGFQYGLNRGLIPITVRILYERIEKNGAVSSLELRDLGVSTQDISWFYQKLVKSKIIKSTYLHEHYLIFYNSDERMKKYMEDYGPYLKDLETKCVRKFKKQGEELEKMVAEYYSSMGFNVERNKFFTNSFGEKVEIDVLASKPEINLMIAIECKNYEASVLGPSILLKIARIKSVLPRALVHIYAKHISNQFFKNKSFFHDEKYRDTFLFSTKQIKEMFEKMNSIPS